MMFVFLFRFVMDGVDILLLYAIVCYLNLFYVLYSLSLCSIVTHPDDKNGVYSFRVTSLHR